MAYYWDMDAVNGIKNLESRSKKDEIPRSAFKKLEGTQIPSLLQKVFAHTNLQDATIRSTQAHIDMLITEQWVKFHLEHPDNKEFVSQIACMRQFCGYTARGLALSASTFFTFAWLPMRKLERKSQHWARRS